MLNDALLSSLSQSASCIPNIDAFTMSQRLACDAGVAHLASSFKGLLSQSRKQTKLLEQLKTLAQEQRDPGTGAA